jgi:hypothetical protein
MNPDMKKRSSFLKALIERRARAAAEEDRIRTILKELGKDLAAAKKMTTSCDLLIRDYNPTYDGATIKTIRPSAHARVSRPGWLWNSWRAPPIGRWGAARRQYIGRANGRLIRLFHAGGTPVTRAALVSSDIAGLSARCPQGSGWQRAVGTAGRILYKYTVVVDEVNLGRAMRVGGHPPRIEVSPAHPAPSNANPLASVSGPYE